MPRYKLTIEYDGSAFYGWQIQLSAATVQGVLTDAIAQINGGPAMVQGAGRTDSGVHALGQVAHVDLLREWDPFVLRNAINAGVRPHKVCVILAEQVPDTRWTTGKCGLCLLILTPRPCTKRRRL
jgi:tRNA pseudouridine38-40 synthase